MVLNSKLILKIFLVISLTATGISFAQGMSQEFLLGNILSKVLESQHFSQKKLDDESSKIAFEELVEKRLDFRKTFFYQKDIKNLEKNKLKMDEQFREGNTRMLTDAYKIWKKRVAQAKGYVKNYLSKPFDFKKKESLQTDYKKRDHVKNVKEHEDLWRRLLKNDVLIEILTSEQGEDAVASLKGAKVGENKKKNKNKKEKNKKKKAFKVLEKEAREKVAKDYKAYFKRIEDMNERDKFSHFANSFTSTFDPHTNYLPPQDKEDFDIEMRRSLTGIGAVLTQDGPYTKVDRIVPGSPSWKGKQLKAGDVILKVGQSKKDPKSIVGMELRDAVRLIRGPKGTEVRLTVKKPNNSTKVIPIVRDVVELEDGFAKGIIIEKDKKKYGYILLPSFYKDFNPRRGQPARNCADDVRYILNEFVKSKVEGLVFDLRNNGGGSLEDAVDIAGQFFPKGPVVQVKGQGMGGANNVRVLADHDPKVVFEKPVVILQNSFSASASEILAGALKDYGRAVVVGSETTHGKGTVQTLINLNNIIRSATLAALFSGPGGGNQDLGALKLTIQKFYRVNGESTQKKGVPSDIVIPGKYDFLESGEKYLENALPYDTVGKASFKKWKGNINKKTIAKLRKKSEKRVKKNPAFQKIFGYLDYMKNVSKQTKRTLNYVTLKNKQAKEKEMIKKFEWDKEIKSLKLSKSFVNNILGEKKIKDKKRFEETQKAREEEFQNKIKKDPYIEEGINILQDLMS